MTIKKTISQNSNSTEINYYFAKQVKICHYSLTITSKHILNVILNCFKDKSIFFFSPPYILFRFILFHRIE